MKPVLFGRLWSFGMGAVMGLLAGAWIQMLTFLVLGFCEL